MPGLTKDDISVSVSPDRVLSIAGERHTESSQGSGEEGMVRVERSYGSFVRRFKLPESVDVDHITACAKDGVLRLSVPKAEAPQPKKIDISVSSE